MIAGFNEWAGAAQLGHTLPLEQLRNHRLGIEAEDYINNILINPPTREPLLPALGGLPFSLEDTVKNHLSSLSQHGIEPYFVFSGLSYTGQENKLQASLKAAKTVANAWELYGNSQPEHAVSEFGTLCTLDVDNVYRYMQFLLKKHGVSFLVAPYSAAAQLASIAGTELCDTVAGSSDILMFEVDKLITKIDFERSEITVVTRKECVEALGCTSIGMFIDACLLAGSSFLPTLPPLENEISPIPKPPRIRAAADLLKQRNSNGNAICLQFQQDDAAMQALNYVEMYRKASSSIKQHVVMRPNGDIETLDAGNASFDVHEFMGQRLPEELFAYLSRGIIGTQVPQWRSSGEMVEHPPLDGGDSPAYQKLVRDSILPLRSSALALLSYSLHRFYQHNDITLRCWFDNGEHKKLGILDASDPKTDIAAWNVRLDQISEKASKLERDISSLAFAVNSLADANFAKKTVTPKANGSKPLDAPIEIRSNALWRFLQLRGYVNSDHTLSPLGQSLHKALAKAADEELEEPVIVALEHLRLNILTPDNMFAYGGAPQRGSDIDKRNTLLVSRVACLAKLRHKSIGFTGPLSRHLLAYRDMAATVRSSLRNLVEMSLCTMLVNGHVARDVSLEELMDVSFNLPFLLDVDCALGIAAKSYLDELAQMDEPTSLQARETIKSKGEGEWFPHAVDFAGDLQRAFTLWDAVYIAVSSAPESVVSSKDKKVWDEVNVWLADRR